MAWLLVVALRGACTVGGTWMNCRALFPSSSKALADSMCAPASAPLQLRHDRHVRQRVQLP